MKKEIKEIQEVEVDNSKKIDREEILRLFKIVHPTSYDQNKIYEMYKKYVNLNAQPPKANCTGCGTSIVSYWRELCDWFNKNKDKF
jgi:hypothetical protein